MQKKPRYAVDRMLGSLAKWLRILGYDTYYRKHIKPINLVSIAQSQDRAIITKNRWFLKSKFPIRIIFLNSNSLKDMLREVHAIIPLETDKIFTRCIVCNEKTIPVQKEEIKDFVPIYVYEHHDEFSRCNGCGKIYWKGTHFERVQNFIEAHEPGK
ncbi:MAG TPA: hypothetical protein ENG70_05630 [Candidatus Cloacimonetes bacterium]|nr:hypothetical protein [Candidatus Cloacimonadota bacterium]HEX38313.1 hypothetical protein [Candidatus Cloacimonadota bacterium]